MAPVFIAIGGFRVAYPATAAIQQLKTEQQAVHIHHTDKQCFDQEGAQVTQPHPLIQLNHRILTLDKEAQIDA